MKMIKKLLAYGVGTVLSKLIMYILLPIYTTAFSAGVYGEVNISLTTTTMLTSLAFIEIWTAFLRFGFGKEEKDFRRLYSSVLIMSLSLIPIFILLTLFVAKWQSLLYVPQMMAYGITLLIFDIEQYLCRIKGKQTIYVISGIISSLIQLSLALIFVRLSRLTPDSILVFPTIGHTMAALFMIICTRQYQHFSFRSIKKSEIKELFRFSIPLSINSMAFWGMNNFGRYIARNILGAEANGYISVANKFTAIILLLVNIYELAWQELAFENMEKPERDYIYSNEFSIYQDVMSAVTIGATIAIDIIFPYYINSDYATARLILPIYLLSSLISSFSTFQGVIFSVAKKNNLIVIATVVGLVVSSISVFLLVKVIDVFCVPVGLLLGMFSNTATRYFYINRRIGIKLKIDVLKLLVDILFVGCAVATVYCLDKITYKAMVLILLEAIILFKRRKEIIVNDIIYFT